MKAKLIITSLILFVSSQSFAQQDAISRYFSALEDDRANTVVSISGMMFSIFSKLESDDKEDQEVLNAMSKLTGLKILNKDIVHDGFAEYKAAVKKLPPSEFELLMDVREEDQDMSFFIKERNGKVMELLMVAGGRDSFFLLSIVGDIDLAQISKISKSMDIEGLDELEKIDEKRKKN